MATQKRENFITPMFRSSYAYCFEPYVNDNGTAKYQITMVFDPEVLKKDPEELERFKVIKAKIEAAGKEKFGSAWGNDPKLHNPLRKIQEYDTKDLEKNPWLLGMYVLKASSNDRPVVSDPSLTIDYGPDDTDKFYSGCYARARISIYAYEKGGGRGVALGFTNVQKVRDGERLSGGAVDSKTAFGDFAVVTPLSNGAEELFEDDDAL